MAKATELLKAYESENIPDGGGFIVSAFFESGTAYGIYEITAYRNVKDIFKTKEGINFKTDGNRTHLLVEPPTFSKKYVEPALRDQDKSIPYRFNEMEIMTCKKSEKIMIPRIPKMLHSSFTVLDRQGDCFAFVFEPTPDVYVAMKKFIADSLYNDCNVSKQDATQAAETVLETVKKFTIWNV